MAVRVKIEFHYRSNKAIGVALANAGFESDVPEVVVPSYFAKGKLKIKRKGKKEKFIAAGEKEVEFEYVGNAEIRVVTPDKISDPVKVRIYVSRFGDEILLSDATISSLRIILLNVKDGIWRFVDDLPDRERASEPKEIY